MAEEVRNQEGCAPEACSSCASAGNCPSKRDPADLIEKQNIQSNIKHVIGIVSGKGGVGKSFVTGTLAVSLRKMGFNVGILDADITGPSIAKMFGLRGELEGCEDGIYPMETEDGIKAISMNMLLGEEDTPVLWRGPVISGVVKQFWTDVCWGDIDYLLVDMPPGTGDVPMTVYQSIPIDGIIIVTSPQSLVNMIVKKAYNMAGQMHIKVLGVIENYSYIECPDCGRKLSVFGESNIDAAAAEVGTRVLGKLPIRPAYASLSDEGKFTQIDTDLLDEACEAIKKLPRHSIR